MTDAATATTKRGAETNGGPAQAMSDIVRNCPIGAGDGNEPAAQVPAGLSDVQRRAAYLLLSGTPIGQVASECRVSPRTVYRWRYESEPFRAELERARRRHWDVVADRLRALVVSAFDVLSAEIVDEYDRSRVRAAGMVLRAVNVRKLIEDEMTERDK